MQRTILAFGAVAAIVCAALAPVAAQSRITTAGAPRQGTVSSPRADARPVARRRAPRKAAAAKLSVVQLRLRRDAPLAQAVLSRLPTGTDLMATAAGFGDIPQFLAAVNVSRALDIPMRELRRRMVGDRMPLLLAIQDIRLRSNYRLAARRAEDEAAAMLRGGSTPPLTLAKRKG